MSLHADVAVPAHDRRRLEQLCRYVARPPLVPAEADALDLGPGDNDWFFDQSLAYSAKTLPERRAR